MGMKTKKIRLADVKISDAFREHVPSPEKAAAKAAYVKAHGRPEEPIKIDPDGFLLDGYAGYLAMKEAGIETCDAQVKKTGLRIQGHHVKRPGKAYYWAARCRKAAELKPGDEAAVMTRYGMKMAVVDAIERVPAIQLVGLSAAIGPWDRDKRRAAWEAHKKAHGAMTKEDHT